MKTENVVVSGIKSSYSKGEPIRITITNKSTQDKYISLGLFSFVEEENEWFDQVSDLSNYNCNSREKLGVTYRLLKSSETTKVFWYPKKANKQFCFNWLKNKGIFRIEVHVKEDINAKPTNLLSSSFTIN